jgi:hypothetical protein
LRLSTLAVSYRFQKLDRRPLALRKHLIEHFRESRTCTVNSNEDMHRKRTPNEVKSRRQSRSQTTWGFEFANQSGRQDGY